MRIGCRKKQKTHGQTVGAVNPCDFRRNMLHTS